RPRAVRRRSRRRAVPLRSRAATGRRDERLRQGGSIPDLGMALPDQQHWLHARVAAVSLRAELSWLSRPGAAQSHRSLPSEKNLELRDLRVGVGHLNFTNPDPADKDNIMLTGWFGLHVGMYMLNSGDRHYTEPGSLTFRLNRHRAFPHDIHSLEHSVLRNFLGAPFCLFPCQPNWGYPICNHVGMPSMAVYDRLFGTKYVASALDKWLKSLETEFTDYSGSVIGLRSELTGIRFPFPAGEAGFAMFENCFAP